MGAGQRYKKNTVGKKEKEFFFADGSDYLSGQGFVVEVLHVSSGKKVKFKAFMTAYNDTFSQEWNTEQVYGRADPLYNFKQTTRQISIGFKMVAASEGEAYENLTKAQLLAQFMYPNYADVGGAKTLSQAPLIRLKVMTLLQDASSTEAKAAASPDALYSSYGVGETKGVLGFFDNITYTFNLENPDNGGVFEKTIEGKKNGTILPKTIDVAIGGFKPIHEQHIGWDENGQFAGGGAGALFPYGAQGDFPENGYPDLDALQKSYSEFLRRKDEEAKAEAAIANAEARYGGMFGKMRSKRDFKRLKKGKLKGSKGRYIASALAGQAAIEAGYTDDGELDSSEIAQIQDVYDYAEGFVE